MKNTKIHQKYKLKSGTIVPGVTTVISNLGWNKNVLVAWARRLAIEEIDPEKVKYEASEIGTLTHYLIECDSTGEKADTSGFSQKVIDVAKNAFNCYLQWKSKHRIEYLQSELQLVSEKYKFGGTADRVCLLDGELSVLDWKTSNGLYPEMKIQIVAYQHLYQENFSKLPTPYLIHLSKKKKGMVEEAEVTDTETYWKIFLHLLRIYDLRKQLSR